MKFLTSLISLGGLVVLVAAEPDTAPHATPQDVPNFLLLDSRGRAMELDRANGEVVVLFFTGNGCPIARQSIPKIRELRQKFGSKGVVFWMVNSYAQDDRAGIRKEAEEFRVGSIPILLDQSQALALGLGVRRTCEAIAVNAKDRTIIYRGAIDDQLTEGAKKPAPTERYLETALTEFLAGKEVTRPKTAVHGCAINFEKVSEREDGLVSYAKQVAPILRDKCVSCHSEGNIGPFAMSSYRKVKNKASMIEEVIVARRMPPWHADPHYGKFENDRSLTTLEVQTLLRWIQQGAPRGDGGDPLEQMVAAPSDWTLGKPDYIVKLPKPEAIPATGVLDYRHILVKSPIPHDAWLGAVDVRPGNRKVVHHVIARMKYKSAGDDGSGRGAWLVGWAPGASAARYPAGTGKFIAKDTTLDLEMHYTTMGSPQTDETEIGLYLLPEKPALAFQDGGAWNNDFSIPPGESDARTFSMHPFTRDTLIYGLSPHMHLRGSWMKYEALYPTGKREVLLSVPRYDFNWQTTYRLAEPKHIPAGTWLLCTGGFDNSARNPANPDPAKRVKWGDQSWDEMFIGFFQASDIPKAAPALSSK
ncbi:MAG: redoxin family protein [Verrucomicrobia subdivision 3 bacterium]|nr:redoxin family protein [Limisphaerales bacterium]